MPPRLALKEGIMERLVDLLPKTLQCLDRKTLSGRMRQNSTMISVMRIPRPRHSIFTTVSYPLPSETLDYDRGNGEKSGLSQRVKGRKG